MFPSFKKVGNLVQKVFSDSRIKVMLMIGLCLIGASVFAEGEAVTLPTTGVDVAGYVTATITALGAIVAVCLGGYVAFKLVKMGMAWLKSIGK